MWKCCRSGFYGPFSFGRFFKVPFIQYFYNDNFYIFGLVIFAFAVYDFQKSKSKKCGTDRQK